MGVRIVIVDDYAPFRSAARALLEGDQVKVVGEAGDAASALATTRRLRPDVVLVDVHLPDMDGFELARRLGAGQHAPAVILISSRGAGDFPSRLAGTSALGFISKSDLSVETIANLLQVIL